MDHQGSSSEVTAVRERLQSVDVARSNAPGAVPPTGGVPPEDAAAAFVSPPRQDATEDLVDALDLMLRAARKLSGGLDPKLEQLADRVVRELQQLETDSPQHAERMQQLEGLCAEAVYELRRVIEAVAVRVESLFAEREPVGV
jgi:hypothetical protein